MNKILYFTALVVLLSATCTAQIVECRIVPTKSSFDCYENIILKVQLRNNSGDTVCVDNIAHDFGGRPMRIFINEEEYPYQGLICYTPSGVYVSPYSEYCFYMVVRYSLPEHMGVTRSHPGMHELQYHSNIIRVKNRRPTSDIVGRISGSVKFEVHSSKQSESIARILLEKSINNGMLIDGQERFRLVYELIQQYGIDAVARVTEYKVYTAGYVKGVWSDKVHSKAVKLAKKLTTGVPGECDCRWDE